MTKGADNVIATRLALGQQNILDATLQYVDEYAQEGLRTLLLAQREVPFEVYKNWSIRYEKAIISLDTNKEILINKLAEEMERDLELVGSTAIEDKLQEEAADVISFIKEAGVKFWVLTGDKVETAINIGYSCEVLDDEMEIFIIDAKNTKGIY